MEHFSPFHVPPKKKKEWNSALILKVVLRYKNGMTLLRASCHCHPDTKQNLMWKYGESGNIWNTFRYTYPFVTILHTLSHTYSLFHSHTRSKSQHCYCSSKCYLEGLVFTKILYFQPRFRCCSLFFCSQENAKKSR